MRLQPFSSFYGNTVPFFKPTDLNSGYYVKDSADKLSDKGAKHARMIPERCTLVTCIGATIGKTGFNRIAGTTNQQINSIIPNLEIIFPEYLYFLCISPQTQKLILNNASSTTLPIINKSKFSKLLIPIPPLNEQKRIISKVEELFSEIDFQIQTTKQTKSLLKLNIKSLLKNAFNGNLTKTWRETHSPKKPKELLNKIEKERENNNLEKFDKNTSSSYDFDNDWEISPLGFVTENHDGKRIPVSKVKRKEMKGKYPYYGASGIIDYVNKPLFKGRHLLIGEDGANLLARSTPIAFIADGEFWVNNHAHVLTTLGEIPLEFISHFINSIDLSEWVTGTAQPKLNQRNMNKIPIPIPSIEEQIEIVKIIEQDLSLINKQFELLKIWSISLSKLRIAILKQAFEGKLVPQDPNDESASELLKRIKLVN